MIKLIVKMCCPTTGAPPPELADMTFSERAYFESDHCAHCATREERQRMQWVARRVTDGLRRHARSDRRGR